LALRLIANEIEQGINSQLSQGAIAYLHHPEWAIAPLIEAKTSAIPSPPDFYHTYLIDKRFT
jgi:hypothetical protein